MPPSDDRRPAPSAQHSSAVDTSPSQALSRRIVAGMPADDEGGSQPHRLLAQVLRRVRALEQEHGQIAAADDSFPARITTLRDTLRASYPHHPRATMRKLFGERLRQHHHLAFDPDKTFLHAFDHATIVGEEIHHLGLPVRSYPVAQLIVEGFPVGTPWDDLANLDATAGIYHSGAGIAAAGPAGLSASDLKTLIDPLATEANALCRDELARWWDSRQGDAGDHAHALLLAAQAWQIAHAQHKLGLLSDMALQMFMLAQTRERASPQVANLRCYWLNIGGYTAEDIVVLQAGSHPFFQTYLLYIPGEAQALREFEGLGGLYDGLVATCSNASDRRRLAGHFAQQDRPDSYKAGIDTLLHALGEGDDPRSIKLAEGLRVIHGDITDAIARRQCGHALDELARIAAGDNPVDAAGTTALEQRRARLFPDLRALHLLAAPCDATDAWTQRLVDGIDQHAAAGTAWGSDSEVEPARGIPALPVQEQQRLYTRRITLEAAQAALQSLMPDIETEGARYMRQFVSDTFGVDIPDPTQTYLHRFQPMMRPASNPRRGYWSEINPDRFKLISATPLSELPVTNLADYDARYSVVSSTPHPANMHAAGDSLLPADRFIAAVRSSTFDFFGHYTARIDDFYRDHGPEQSALARQLAIFEADVLHHEGQLGPDDHALALRAFGPEDAGTASDADGPAVHPLRLERWYSSLADYTSNNALHIEGNDGRTLLYLPGNDNAIRAFASRDDAVAWMMSMGAPEARQFATAHFSLDDAEERLSDNGAFTRDGVAKFLQNSGAAGHIPPRSGASPSQYLTARDNIAAAPFDALLDIDRQGMIRDARYLITSPTDLKKQQWRDILSWTPLSPVNLFLDKTAAERKETLEDVKMEVLLGLLEMAAGGTTKGLRVASRGTGKLIRGGSTVPGVVRWSRKTGAHAGQGFRTGILERLRRSFRPPRRVNGQIGYPLSPDRPPHLMRSTDFDITLQVDGATLSRGGFSFYDAVMDLPDSQWLDAERKTFDLLDTAEAFFTSPEKRWRPAALPEWPEPPQSIDEFIRRTFDKNQPPAYLLNRGLIFGENHASDATRIALIANLPALKEAGVKTLYMEHVVRDLAGESLDRFNADGVIEGTLSGMIDYLRNDERLRDLLTLAREYGMKIVGIDNIASQNRYEEYARVGKNFDRYLPDEPNPYPLMRRSKDRLQTMNYHAYLVMQEEQARNGGQPWVALVGAAHAVESRDVPGLRELLGCHALHAKFDGVYDPSMEDVDVPVYVLIPVNPQGSRSPSPPSSPS